MAYGDDGPMTNDEATLMLIHDCLVDISRDADDPAKVRAAAANAFQLLDELVIDNAADQAASTPH